MPLKIITAPQQNAHIAHVAQSSSHCLSFSYPSEEYSNHSQALLVGKYNTVYRSLMQFDLSNLPFIITIFSGILNLRLFRNENYLLNKIIDVFQILSPWQAEQLSWKDQPLIMDKPAGSIIITPNYLGDINVDITNLVQQWHSGEAANLGIMLKMRDENLQSLVGFYRKEYPNSLYWPQLQMNYLDPCYPSPGLLPKRLTDRISITAMYTLESEGLRDILSYYYSYIVVNTGLSNAAKAYLEVSADKIHLEIQSAVTVIQPGQQSFFIPNIIAQYARLCYQTLALEATTPLMIYIQGRS
jgi:hypothetical protein